MKFKLVAEAARGQASRKGATVTNPSGFIVLRLRLEHLRKFHRFPTDLYVNPKQWERLIEQFDWLLLKPRLFGMNVWPILEQDTGMRVA